MSDLSVLDEFQNHFDSTRSEVISLSDYLDLCKSDKQAYATPAERMLAAIGEPIMVDTSKNQRLARIFGNRIIRTYPSFSDFFGMEETIEALVNFFRHAAQGLEEDKQLLYLLGPVGGGKSSLVERIKELMERQPIYVLGYNHPKLGVVHSPYLARPLPLFNRPGIRDTVSKKYNIDVRYIKGVIGPWEAKRLKEFGGDISKFCVIKMYPSRQSQIAVANTEPGDENTQDVSTLLGKVDIRKLEEFSQNDPDAYLFSGGLNLSNQGILDFREMFKAKIKMLNPLLFAVQEHNYQGTEQMGALPYDGIVVAHSNEAEWSKFRNNKDNEAFIDRICTVKVPYCLRITEEIAIYKKYLSGTDMGNAIVAPFTLDFIARFCVLGRLKAPGNSKLESKMKVYDGENLKERDPRAKTHQEYKDDPENRTEGFFGPSTRWAFKRLSQCFNADPTEKAANPVHLMRVIIDDIVKSDLPKDLEETYKNTIRDVLRPEYLEFLDKEIRTAYLESYSDYGQNLFDRYVMWADKWVNDEDHFDAESATTLNTEALNSELEKVEKAADIVNPKDFRNEVVRYVLRYAKEHGGKNPDWRSYEKLRLVIEKRMFSMTEDILPVISFAPKGTEDEKKKHSEFVDRMKARGYTEKQVRLLIDWYMKVRKTT